MIPKTSRLPKERFSERPPARINSKCFSVKVFENNLDCNRFGVIVSGKVDKRASRRNFWRRKILGRAMRQLGAGRGKDLIIIASPQIQELSKSAVEQELEKIFEKCKTMQSTF